MVEDRQVMAELLTAILEEFSSIMGRKAAYGTARRGASQVLAKYQSLVEKDLMGVLPPELLRDR